MGILIIHMPVEHDGRGAVKCEDYNTLRKIFYSITISIGILVLGWLFHVFDLFTPSKMPLRMIGMLVVGYVLQCIIARVKPGLTVRHIGTFLTCWAASTIFCVVTNRLGTPGEHPSEHDDILDIFCAGIVFLSVVFYKLKDNTQEPESGFDEVIVTSQKAATFVHSFYPFLMISVLTSFEVLSLELVAGVAHSGWALYSSGILFCFPILVEACKALKEVYGKSKTKCFGMVLFVIIVVAMLFVATVNYRSLIEDYVFKVDPVQIWWFQGLVLLVLNLLDISNRHHSTLLVCVFLALIVFWIQGKESMMNYMRADFTMVDNSIFYITWCGVGLQIVNINFVKFCADLGSSTDAYLCETEGERSIANARPTDLKNANAYIKNEVKCSHGLFPYNMLSAYTFKHKSLVMVMIACEMFSIALCITCAIPVVCKDGLGVWAYFPEMCAFLWTCMILGVLCEREIITVPAFWRLKLRKFAWVVALVYMLIFVHCESWGPCEPGNDDFYVELFQPYCHALSVGRCESWNDEFYVDLFESDCHALSVGRCESWNHEFYVDLFESVSKCPKIHSYNFTETEKSRAIRAIYHDRVDFESQFLGIHDYNFTEAEEYRRNACTSAGNLLRRLQDLSDDEFAQLSRKKAEEKLQLAQLAQAFETPDPLPTCAVPTGGHGPVQEETSTISTALHTAGKVVAGTIAATIVYGVGGVVCGLAGVATGAGFE